MRILLVLILLLGSFFCQAQELSNYQEVDKFKVNGLTTKVYFNDPLKRLIAKHPDFDNKENQTKHVLLSEYLHNNPIYVFKTTNKKKVVKSYWLIGDPRKVRTKNYFKLEIKDSDNSTEKIIDNVNIGGSFFEHMMFFQTPQGSQSIGKGIQIWGYFTMVQPYEPLKSTMIQLMKMDITNTIPEEILAKEEERIEPLFEYQKCALENVIGRTFTITVLQYDSLGNVKNKYPREEKDKQLYHSSTSKNLTGVTTFPYFSSDDKTTKSDSVIHVESGQEYLNHYLKEIRIIKGPTNQTERVEGKLIIHGYSAKGHSTNDELYIAEFSKIGDCNLPRLVKFCPLNDPEFKRPRLIIEIEYELK
ncbi:hypothetical protein E1176_09480 [Fulvivirga sp. RKSG066]|uniref:hypothetical protein n=1 Tax=Fulvivirga aurantia TaxID=2529383 RepID=UPI0012BC5B60|nr:hypothetical protein [Fulvivirga aurantia]MTI21250.1 hypothetical protein [Fulvivirga aurantia]